MKIQSTVFSNETTIPIKYSCDGERVNPPLNFSDVPKEAQSLALIVHDPDAPGRDYVHLLLWNISPDTSGMEEGNLNIGTLGTNDMDLKDYVPMCPPRGHETHRYFFELYALDTKLELEEGASREELENAMESHILEKAELVGLYTR